MNPNECIEVGMTHEEVYIVEEKHLATHVGSGSARGPGNALDDWIHGTHLPSITYPLPAGRIFNRRHAGQCPSPGPYPTGQPGARVVAEVTAVAGSQITLKVQAWDDVELCGEGEHTRFIIDEARFIKRVQAKTEQIQK